MNKRNSIKKCIGEHGCLIEQVEDLKKNLCLLKNIIYISKKLKIIVNFYFQHKFLENLFLYILLVLDLVDGDTNAAEKAKQMVEKTKK